MYSHMSNIRVIWFNVYLLSIEFFNWKKSILEPVQSADLYLFLQFSLNLISYVFCK